MSGMKRDADAGTSPVPEQVSVSDWDDGSQNADDGGIRLDANAGGIRLDADGQLCILLSTVHRASRTF